MECPKCKSYSVITKHNGKFCQIPSCSFVSFDIVDGTDEVPFSEQASRCSQPDRVQNRNYKTIKNCCFILGFCDAIFNKALILSQQTGQDLSQKQLSAYAIACAALEKDVFAEDQIKKYFKFADDEWTKTIAKAQWIFNERNTRILKHNVEYYIDKFSRKLKIKKSQVKQAIKKMQFGGENPRTIAGSIFLRFGQQSLDKIAKVVGMRPLTISKCHDLYFA